MRWHFVGGIIATLFGILFFSGGVLMLGTTAYYNIRYGPIEFSNGEYEALDQVALTGKNLFRSSSYLLVGSGFFAAARYWFKKRNRIGLLFFGLSFALSGALAAFLRHS